MNIKTITNQSSLTIIIIAIMLLISLGNAQAQTNQKPTSNETVLILELIKQMQTQMAELKAELKAQMAENQKQTNQQMAELKAEMKEIKAEQKELRAEMKELRAEMQTIKQKVDRIGFYFDMLQYVFLTILGSAVIYILALFREQIKNFIINLFTSSKNITNMKIKTITNQSTLTIIIITIMLLISLGNAQAQTNQKPTSNETVLILELIKQMQTQMAENQKQTNQQMAENQKQINQQMAELKAEMKEIKAEQKELRAEMQTIKQKVDRIGFYFDMLQYVFLTILGSAVIYILALFREQIKNFIINLFTSSKKSNVMNIKTITNQSSLTIIIIAIMLLISLGNAQAQTNQKPTSNETVLILELIKQMQTQMAENQKQTNQQMAENQKQINQQMAELKAELKAQMAENQKQINQQMAELKAEMKEIKAEQKELRAEMQTIKQKVDRIGFYFDMLQYVFLTILGSAVIYILALFREQIKNFIINLFKSSKNITNMKIKTITNQSSLTIIIITIMLLISLGNAQAQTNQKPTSNETVLILELIKQMQTQMAENQKQTNQQMAELKAELKAQMAENQKQTNQQIAELKTDVQGLKADVQGLKADIEKIKTLFGVFQSVFAIIFGCGLLFILNLFKQEIKNFIINLFTSSKKSNVMNIKTITNQSSLTIIIIAIMLFISLGNAQAQTNQKPTSNETVLILELIKQMQTQMAENQKQTNQQMAENQKQINQQMAELKAEMKEIKAEQKELRAEMQTIKQKVDRIGFYFDMLQYVFLTILGSAVIYILALFREQIKNFIINLFTSSKNITNMKIKTITNQSSLTIIIIAIMLLISLGNAQAQTNQKPTSNETVLILELIKQMQTQMAENQKQTNQQMAELKAELKAQMAENQKQTNQQIAELKTDVQGLKADVQGLKADIEKIKTLFGVFQSVFAIIFGCGLLFILNLFKQEIKNFIINLFTSSKKINVMNIKTITNQSSLTIIIITIMLLISLGNAQAQTYRDTDSDGLIEISYIDQLDSIRYNLTGTCSGSTCNGYELTKTLDFNSASSYRSEIVNTAFTTGSGWNPIGTYSYSSTDTEFNTTFEGNGFTIDHLFINRASTVDVGLFGHAGSNSRIRNIGLSNVSVTGNANVGGLVGHKYGHISQSYATGSVTGNDQVGGLVGVNGGTIIQSYATGSVRGTGYNVGGLVGYNSSGGTISQSYATGAVRGNINVGGLLGDNDWEGNNSGTVLHGYWNKDATRTGIGTNNGTAAYVRGLTLSALQSPTGTSADSIRELGPGFVYRQGFLPAIDKGARVTINSVNFTQTAPSITNIATTSMVASVIQGTAITRATLTVDGIVFTANVIGTTNITNPYTITNIQNGTGRGIIGRYDTRIYFAVLGVKALGDAPFVLQARSSAGLPVLFSASNTLISINTNTVTINGVGIVDITAYSLENDTVAFASQTQTLTNKRPHSVSFETLADRTFGDAPFVLSASSSTGLSMLFSASNTLIRINNRTVTIRGAGTVNVTAYSENDTIAFASQTQTLTIQKRFQSITFPPLVNKSIEDVSFVLYATSSGGLQVLFSSASPLVTVYYNVVRINEAGTVNIIAYNTGNINYIGTSVSQTLRIIGTNNPTPTLIFTAIPNLTVGQSYVLMATSNSPAPIIFTSSDTNKVSIRGNTATATAVGNVVITASQASNAAYNGATAPQNVTVTDPNLPTPTLTFTAIPNLTVGQSYVMTATSNSVASIVFTSSNERIATVSGNTLTAVSTGTAVITASQEANATHNPATAQQTVTVVASTTSTIIHPLTLIEKGNPAIRIYPNPAQDYITIQTDKTQKIASVKVYDIMGKSYELGIMNYELGLRVDFKTLSKGEYIIILYGEKGEVLKTEKIIKE